MLNTLIDFPITKYYFDTFIVGPHSSIPHLIVDLISRKEIALVEMKGDLPQFKINDLKALVDLIEAKLLTLDMRKLEDLESEEPVYWIHKLGRQSALEIVTYGRVRPETMNLLMCLPEEDFIAAMSVAGRLSAKVQATADFSISQKTNIPASMPVAS